MSPEQAIAAALLVPLLGAAGVLLCRRRPNVREAVTVLATLLTFGAVASLVPAVTAGGRPGLELFEVLPGLPLAFAVEPLGMLFALVASGLWILTSIYAIGYMRSHHEGHQTRFYACFAVAIAAALGIAFAANLFTLFLFYELLTLTTYPLVTHHGDERARRAGRLYLGLLMATSIVLLLTAIIWTYAVAGTLDFRPGGILAGRADAPLAIVLLLLFAFGTGKAALMPFHRWLPAAMVAPTPVSALLHAVAVVKAGVFTVTKIVLYVFGLDLLRTSGGGEILAWVAAATLLLAAAVATVQDNLKRRLAYSTISQLAYVVLGAALANGTAALGGSLHVAMHAMAKITLFFCAGAIAVTAHKTEVSQLDGIGRRMPITCGAFFLASLSIIGLPPAGGTWSKWFLVLGAADGERWAMVAVLLAGSLLAIGYLMPVVVRAFFYPPPAAGEGHGEAPLLCLLPLTLTALGCVGQFVFAEPLYRLLAPIAGM
ncbi:MAG: monovalent cation/H+ antiporter subunit D family protein [Acidobacteria bacterium]|nr:MAG: monovalent cation/H+ antiporter subunit D family protein [Acidobacteriota bacterium]